MPEENMCEPIIFPATCSNVVDVSEADTVPHRRSQHPDGDRRVHLQGLRLSWWFNCRLEPGEIELCTRRTVSHLC